MQRNRGLWRLGWVLWALTTVPIVFVAHQQSIESNYKWDKVGITHEQLATLEKLQKRRGQLAQESALTLQEFETRHGISPLDLDLLKRVQVVGIGAVYLPNYLSEEQTEKAISVLRQEKEAAQREVELGLVPDELYRCTVEMRSNRSKMILYSAVGLILCFILIQGGFGMILKATALLVGEQRARLAAEETMLREKLEELETARFDLRLRMIELNETKRDIQKYVDS